MSITEELLNGANDGSQIDLIGLSRSEMEALFDEIAFPASALSRFGIGFITMASESFPEMTTIAKGLQPKLAAGFMISRPGVTTEKHRPDGTRKWLLNYSDGKMAETVHIPEEDCGAVWYFLAGCTPPASFAATGTQRMVRNLTPVSQASLRWREILSGMAIIEGATPKLTNVVMMGMGEPFTFMNVAKALHTSLQTRRALTFPVAGSLFQPLE